MRKDCILVVCESWEEAPRNVEKIKEEKDVKYFYWKYDNDPIEGLCGMEFQGIIGRNKLKEDHWKEWIVSRVRFPHA